MKAEEDSKEPDVALTETSDADEKPEEVPAEIPSHEIEDLPVEEPIKEIVEEPEEVISEK